MNSKLKKILWKMEKCPHNTLCNMHSCFGLAWINVRYPPKPLYHSLSSTGQGRRNMMKGSRVETKTGRDHSPITVMDKTD